MLAKSTLVALTTALVLSILSSTPVLSLPIEEERGDEAVTRRVAPHTYYTPRPTPSHRIPTSFYEPTPTTKAARVTTTTRYGLHSEGTTYFHWGDGSVSGAGGDNGDNRAQQQQQHQQQQQQRPFHVEHQNTTPSDQGGRKNSNITATATTNITSYSYDYDSIPLEAYHDRRIRYSSYNPKGDVRECYIPPRTYRHVGIDLRENSFAVGYVTDEGKVELVLNENGDLYTPAEVRFIDGGRQAVVGHAAWDRDKDKNWPVVNLTGITSPERYQNYPEGVWFSLSRDHRSPEAEAYYEAAEREYLEKEEKRKERREGYMKYSRSMWLTQFRERQGAEIMAAIYRRAMDMVEARLPEGEKVERIVATFKHRVLTGEEGTPSFIARTLLSTREKEMMYANRITTPVSQPVMRYETLALAIAHVDFFESRVQRDPQAEGGEGGEEDVYLPQTVLLYNLRDKTEDLVVMQYFKGQFKGPFVFDQNPAFEHSDFHIRDLGGYLPHEDRIENGWWTFVMESALERFNRGVGAVGNDVRHMERVESEDLGRFNRTVERLESLWTETTAATSAPETTEREESYIELGPHSSVLLTFKDWREIKLDFLTNRLSRAVNEVLSASGLETKSMVDHLIVADATPRFRGLSTQAMEAVFVEEGKMVVKEVDPERAIVEGVAKIAGIMTAESILEVPYHCYMRKLEAELHARVRALSA